MDVAGDMGGIWRTITTLFQNRALGSSTQQQYQLSIPNCGAMVRDVAIRIVATGSGDDDNDNDNDDDDDRRHYYYYHNGGVHDGSSLTSHKCPFFDDCTTFIHNEHVDFLNCY
ncbi:hypothetical protein BGZ58_000360 [Dissophora ornata]|nr:hypothetical protein BGZ58_000360 [Dissophora ornata]